MERANWVEIPRDDTPSNAAAPYSVSMNTRGDIVMSRRTWQNMGEPEAFKLLFDPPNSRIGLHWFE